MRRLWRLIGRSRPQPDSDTPLTGAEYCAKYGHQWVAIPLKGRWEQKQCLRCGATRGTDIL